MQDMQELKAFNDQRAELYWWLSSLFNQELSAKELAQYHSPQIRGFLSGLGENDQLKPAVRNIISALNRLLERQDAQFELAADFCRLFQGIQPQAPIPCASHYSNTSTPGHSTAASEMAQLMKAAGIANSSPTQPADHIAVELDFLGHMIIRSNELEKPVHMEQAFAEQAIFIENSLINWVPRFAQRCREHDTFGFYAAVTDLLVALLKLDLAYLTNE